MLMIITFCPPNDSSGILGLQSRGFYIAVEVMGDSRHLIQVVSTTCFVWVNKVILDFFE